MNFYVEVRCCCQPTKLLGWLPIGDPAYLPSSFTFRFAECGDGSPLELDDPARVNESLPGAREVRIKLPIGYFGCGIASRPALKSEDTPIETLRKIPGFVENPTPAEVFVDPPAGMQVIG